MEKFERPVVIEKGAGDVVDVLGGAATYKATHAATQGQYSLFEQELPAGYAVPPHRHDAEDEAFYVLEGEIVFEGELGARRAGKGDFAFFPRGCLHGFRNDGAAPARALVICTPGDRLEKCFREFDAAGKRGGLAPASIMAIASSHGVEIAPPA